LYPPYAQSCTENSAKETIKEYQVAVHSPVAGVPLNNCSAEQALTWESSTQDICNKSNRLSVGCNTNTLLTSRRNSCANQPHVSNNNHIINNNLGGGNKNNANLNQSNQNGYYHSALRKCSAQNSILNNSNQHNIILNNNNQHNGNNQSNSSLVPMTIFPRQEPEPLIEHEVVEIRLVGTIEIDYITTKPSTAFHNNVRLSL
jgi:hypothetical protein